jgi:hypothetical protein
MEPEKLIEYGDGIRAGWPAFDSWNVQEIFIPRGVHTESENNITSYLVPSGLTLFVDNDAKAKKKTLSFVQC